MMVAIFHTAGTSPRQLDEVIKVVLAAIKLKVNKVSELATKGEIKMERGGM